jgi:hypothetical protein
MRGLRLPDSRYDCPQSFCALEDSLEVPYNEVGVEAYYRVYVYASMPCLDVSYLLPSAELPVIEALAVTDAEVGACRRTPS